MGKRKGAPVRRSAPIVAGATAAATAQSNGLGGVVFIDTLAEATNDLTERSAPPPSPERGQSGFRQRLSDIARKHGGGAAFDDDSDDEQDFDFAPRDVVSSDGSSSTEDGSGSDSDSGSSNASSGRSFDVSSSSSSDSDNVAASDVDSNAEFKSQTRRKPAAKPTSVPAVWSMDIVPEGESVARCPAPLWKDQHAFHVGSIACYGRSLLRTEMGVDSAATMENPWCVNSPIDVAAIARTPCVYQSDTSTPPEWMPVQFDGGVATPGIVATSNTSTTIKFLDREGGEAVGQGRFSFTSLSHDDSDYVAGSGSESDKHDSSKSAQQAGGGVNNSEIIRWLSVLQRKGMAEVCWVPVVCRNADRRRALKIPAKDVVGNDPADTNKGGRKQAQKPKTAALTKPKPAPKKSATKSKHKTSSKGKEPAAGAAVNDATNNAMGDGDDDGNNDAMSDGGDDDDGGDDACERAATRSICTSVVQMHVALTSALFRLAPTEADDEPSLQMHWKALRVLMPALQPSLVGVNPCDSSSGFDRHGLYNAVRRVGKDLTGGAPPVPQHTMLKEKLFPHQLRAASWMIMREKGQQSAHEGKVASEINLHPLWRRVRRVSGGGGASVAGVGGGGGAADGGTDAPLYFNPFSGGVTLQQFPMPPPQAVRGGILADEMGLGKTLEVMQTLLSNPAVLADSAGGALNTTGKASAGSHAVASKDFVMGEAQNGSSAGGAGVGVDTDDAHAPNAPTDGVDADAETTDRVRCVETCYYANIDPEDSDVETPEDWVQCDVCHCWLHLDCLEPPHPGPDDDYECPRCEDAKPPPPAPGSIVSKTTLIICPVELIEQWRYEFGRHVRDGALSIGRWRGIKAGDRQSAHELAAHDVILTTYEVLQAELHHVDIKVFNLKRRKRYKVTPTPLIALRWWRVVLDEAQMVDNPTAKSAEMALRLWSVHRWCVSGTPIARGLSDLHGLFLFLGARPFCYAKWWKLAFHDPYLARAPAAMKQAHEFLRTIMWRTQKRDSEGEIGLPGQTTVVHRLTFSYLELTFYRKQEADCAVLAQSVLSSMRKQQRQLGSDTHGVEKRVLQSKLAERALIPLLRLRQACCDPTVGKSGIKSTTHSHRAILSWDEVQDKIIASHKLTCEESQRIALLNITPLAALAIEGGDYEAAAAIYREGLALCDENAKLIRADWTVRLHIVVNLAEVLAVLRGDTAACGGSKTEAAGAGAGGGAGAGTSDGGADSRAKAPSHTVVIEPQQTGRTLDGPSYTDQTPEQLLKEAADIRSTQVAAEVANVAFRVDSMNQATAAYEQASAFSGAPWAEALTIASQDSHHASALLEKIRSALESVAHQADMGDRHDATTILNRFHDLKGLSMVLAGEFEALNKARKTMLEALKPLCREPTKADIALSGNCRCRPGHFGKECQHCAVEKLTLAWRKHLFHVRTIQTNATAAAQFGAVDDGGANDRYDLFGVEGDHGKRKAGKTEMLKEMESESQHVLHTLAVWARDVLGPNDVVSKGLVAMREAMELQRKELKCAVKLWRATKDRISILDEMDMATTRLRVRREGEELWEHERRGVIDAFEVAEKVPQHEAERDDALRKLAAARTQLVYLQMERQTQRAAAGAGGASLVAAEQRASGGGAGVGANVDAGGGGGGGGGDTGIAAGEITASTHNAGDATRREEVSTSVPRDTHAKGAECPCCCDTKDVFCILVCGHNMCRDCALIILEQGRGQNIKCPICRHRSAETQFHFVTHGGPSSANGGDDDGSGVTVKGEWSAKIKAVVRQFLVLRAMDQYVKVLIFSQWMDVLRILAAALTANDIKHLTLQGKGSYQRVVPQFRSDVTISALLMPFRSGSSGLNLTEATHVFLVEPLLNRGTELQAVGRVHRIGQVKETTVHRFIVEASVEERVMAVIGARHAHHKKSHRAHQPVAASVEAVAVHAAGAGGTGGGATADGRTSADLDTADGKASYSGSESDDDDDDDDGDDDDDDDVGGGGKETLTSIDDLTTLLIAPCTIVGESKVKSDQAIKSADDADADDASTHAPTTSGVIGTGAKGRTLGHGQPETQARANGGAAVSSPLALQTTTPATAAAAAALARARRASELAREHAGSA